MFSNSFTANAQLSETVWNFPANFNKHIEIGDVLNLRDGAWSLGIVFHKDGKFNRTDQIRYYENEPYKRKPDNLKGTWRLEIVGPHIYLYMTFSKKSYIKFDVLKLDEHWLKVKTLEKE